MPLISRVGDLQHQKVYEAATHSEAAFLFSATPLEPHHQTSKFHNARLRAPTRLRRTVIDTPSSAEANKHTIMADTNGANGAPAEDIVEQYDVLPKMIQHLDRITYDIGLVTQG